MLDDVTGEGICVIDLDTTMPGSAIYDFGDMIRTATSPAAEDEKDVSKVTMRMFMFEALVQGYLSSAKSFLTPLEKSLLPFSGKLLTMECGIRFLTDYLSGDVYFKIHRPEHNLDRCRTQMALVESIEAQMDEMKAIVDRGDNQTLLKEALQTADRADVIVAALGECSEMSGESASRTTLEIPDAQRDLLKALVKTGKPVVLLLFTGRPLVLTEEAVNIPSILNVWFGGSEAGDAIADVLFGKVNPSGKLTTSFPRSVGQLPLYYNSHNTSRPDPDKNVFNRYTSNYLEDSNEPLYPFGYGLSYTHFQYDNMVLSSNVLKKGEKLTVSVIVTNKGNYDGCEVVQLYLHDIYADVVRPVKELKDFKRIFLKKGESREVRFVITEEDLKFYNSNLQYIYETGDFEVMVGTNSRDVQSKTFFAE